MSIAAPIIRLRDVTFKRGDRYIYDRINIDIPEGKVTAIMGPSGTGKTTLLRLIGGQLQPDMGSVFVRDTEVHSLGREALFTLRESIGTLFQSGALFTDMNVFENVAFPLRVHTKLPEDMIEDVVMLKLEAVGLRGAYNLMPSELSGGMSRRVALARAVALDPDIVLYDEPFTGQDPISMGVLLSLIRKMNQVLGLTSIVVSHDLVETLTIADYVFLIAEGKVIGEGTPQELQKMRSPMVKQFIGGFPDGPVRFHFQAPSLTDQLLPIK